MTESFGEVLNQNFSLILSLSLIKLMIQLHKRPFLYSRHIAAADAELLRYFPLRPFISAMLQSKAADDDLLLAVIQYIKVLINLRFFYLQLYLIYDIVGLGTKVISLPSLSVPIGS